MSLAFTEEEAKLVLGFDMFEGDFGDPEGRTFSNKIVKAAKDHECHHCGEDINLGQPHRAQRELFDGSVQTFRTCFFCCKAWIKDDDGEAISRRMELRDADQD